VHDHVDPMGLGTGSNTHGVDMTMKRRRGLGMIVARCGGAPRAGRFTFTSDGSWSLDRSEVTPERPRQGVDLNLGSINAC
jgi:hypothetical protein